MFLKSSKAFSVYLSNPSGIGKNEVAKKTVYDELVKKVNAIQTTDTSNLVKKVDYDTITKNY